MSSAEATYTKWLFTSSIPFALFLNISDKALHTAFFKAFPLKPTEFKQNLSA